MLDANRIILGHVQQQQGFTHMERRAKKMGWKCTKVVTLHVPRRRRKARK